MSVPFTVTDLRHRPDFASTVALRVWQAWWVAKGRSLSEVEALVGENLRAGPIPSAFVAHDGDAFLGTASLITCDLDARPHYTPWIAAVWVEEHRRGCGVGARMLRAAADRAHALGFDRAYLCAMPRNHAFYARRGWSLLERDVTPEGLAIFRSR